MQIGIFTKTFVRSTLAETLDAVGAHGLRTVQFNFECAGPQDMPDQIAPELASSIRRELASRDLSMAAVSGTFNMIDPDLNKRSAGMRRLAVLAAACRSLGTSIITLCTGTRDPHNMWRRHPDNDSRDAWHDLTVSMSQALRIAEDHDVVLGIEPEVANVVDSAHKARRLIDEMRSPRLKIVMDGANLFHPGELDHMSAILDEAFSLLGEEIVIAHAKDLLRDDEGPSSRWAAAGKGRLDYQRYIALLYEAGFTGALILHGLQEDEVAGCIAFLVDKLGRTLLPDQR